MLPKIPWKATWFEKPWVSALRPEALDGRPVVIVNGVWDGLLAAHIQLLRGAAEYGTAAAGAAAALLVAVESDAAASARLPDGRPIQSETERIAAISALPWVDAVAVYENMADLSVLAASVASVAHVRGSGPFLVSEGLERLSAQVVTDLSTDEFWRRVDGRRRTDAELGTAGTAGGSGRG